MTAQVKAFADYEVLTASDVNNYLMNQAFVKVINTTERDALSTSIKSAYNTTTGDVYYRDSANTWLTYNTSLQSYTPVWTTAGTAPSLGNGTVTGRYLKSGRQVTFSAILTAGSTSTYGTSYFELSLPFAATSTMAQALSVCLTDASASARWAGTALVPASATKTSLILVVAGGAGLTGAAPIAWANGDALTLSGTYMVDA